MSSILTDRDQKKREDAEMNKPTTTEEDKIPNWSQIRIFSKEFHMGWYFSILKSFAAPLRKKFPDLKFWFTRYITTPEEDSADTKIELLDEQYFNQGRTFSLRIRFEKNEEAEKLLMDRIDATDFWASGVLSYDFLKGHSEPRFSHEFNLRRANLVADLFCANSELILDSIDENGFEFNSHIMNLGTNSISHSVLHILANPHYRTHSPNDRNVDIPFSTHIKIQEMTYRV